MKGLLGRLRNNARNRVAMTAGFCESCAQVCTEACRARRSMDRFRYGFDQHRPLG